MTNRVDTEVTVEGDGGTEPAAARRWRAASLRPVAEHLLGALLIAVAATPWLAVIDGTAGIVHLGVAILAATAVSVLVGRVLRRTLAVEILVSLVLLALTLLVVVVGDVTAGDQVLRGLRDGFPRLLSTTLPMIDVAWAGVPGTVVVWLAAAVVAATVARTRTVAPAVLAGLVCFVGGFAVTLGGRAGDLSAVAVPEGLVLAGVAGVLALARRARHRDGEERSVRVARLAGAVATLVVALVAGAVAADLGPFLPDEPVQPRLTPVVAELEPEPPLLVARRLREDEPDRPVATVAVDAPWSGYLPIAVLDRYDGRSWSRTDERLQPTGGVLPSTLPSPDGPEVVVRDLDVASTGGWLPYVGRVEALAGTSVVQDDGEVFRLAEPAPTVTYRARSGQPSGTLDDDALEGDQPTARTSGLVPPLEVARLVSDQREAGERVCRLLALTAGAEAATAGELGVVGAPCARRGPDTVAFLRGVASELAAGRAVEVDPDGGVSAGGAESLADLLDLVGPPTAEGTVTGAPEQFAAAYALMVDGYGLPVRLVTGFRLDEPEAGASTTIRGADAWTWAEVAVDGLGWVVVDPTPSAEDVADDEPLEQAQALEEQDPTPQEAPAELGVDAETVVVGPPAAEPDPVRPPWWSVVVAVAMALVGTPLLLATLRRGRRRWRRRRGDPRTRVVGAWHQVLDLADDAGIDVPSLTTRDLVDALAGRATRAAADLARLPVVVDRAVYSSRPVPDGDADLAWGVVASVRRELRRTSPRRRRLANAFRVPPRHLTRGPRPSRRRRRRDRRRGGGGPPVVPTLPVPRGAVEPVR